MAILYYRLPARKSGWGSHLQIKWVGLTAGYDWHHVSVQGLLKKHEAFETDLTVHKDRVGEAEAAGGKLIKQVRKPYQTG